MLFKYFLSDYIDGVSKNTTLKQNDKDSLFLNEG